MKIIVPCCGRSSRFPGQPPKWTLPAHDGRPMLCLALSGIPLSLDDLIVTILREHEEKYGISEGLTAAFGRPIRLAILDRPTRSQSETVACTIKQVDLQEPFFVKDSDGYFEFDTVAYEHNYVCVDTLNNYDLINPRNKSYVQVDETDRITTMREKVVISDLFNVGGYHFTSPSEFMRFYDALASKASGSELYLSNVISAMLAEGVPFFAPDRWLPGLGYGARLAPCAAGSKSVFCVPRRISLRARLALFSSPFRAGATMRTRRGGGAGTCRRRS